MYARVDHKKIFPPIECPPTFLSLSVQVGFTQTFLGIKKLSFWYVGKVLKNYVTCYKFDSCNWLKVQNADWRKYFNQLQHSNL